MLPEVVIDVGFTATGTSGYFTVGHPVLGQVGVVPVGPEDVWTTLPAEAIRSWSVRRGASTGDAPTLRYDPATAVVELNDGFRAFDPDNLAGPYVVGGVSQVEAMRRVRIRAVWDSVSYPLFYGHADDWRPDYQGSSWTYTTLTATDGSKLLAAPNRGAVAPVGAGEDSGARVTRILDAFGWPADARSIAVGDTTVQETTLAGSPLTELLLVQDTEQGEWYIDATGRAVFRNRRAVLTEARSTTPQVVFGDGGGAEVPYADARMSTPADTLINWVDAARAGGTEQHVEDTLSVGRYGPRTHTRDDLLMEDDDTALQWAHWLRHQYATPTRRFAAIEFNTPAPQVEAAHWPAVLGRELGDRVTVVRRPAGGGDPIQRDCFVRGVEHRSDGAAWTSAMVLQAADRYAFFTIGHPTLGQVDYNAVAY